MRTAIVSFIKTLITEMGIMSKKNAESNSNVTMDASLAKDNGLSYGKYKVGIKHDFTESDYPVMPTQFVARKSEQNDFPRAKAFIK